MTDWPGWVDVLLAAGAVSTALVAIGAAIVKLYAAARRIDERVRRAEAERIEAAAGRLIDKAAETISSQLGQLGDRIEAIDRRQRDDLARRVAQLGEWEAWRAGVDSRLDLLEMSNTTGRRSHVERDS